jgi:hypothetical protein
MESPCSACSRQGNCDHHERCIRWRSWLDNEWRGIKKLYEKKEPKEGGASGPDETAPPPCSEEEVRVCGNAVTALS